MLPKYSNVQAHIQSFPKFASPLVLSVTTSSDVTSLYSILVVELLGLKRLLIVPWLNDGPSYSANGAPNHKCFLGGHDTGHVVSVSDLSHNWSNARAFTP